MNSDSRMLIYLSIMALLFSCVALGYSLAFFGSRPPHVANEVSVLPVVIVVVGIIIAAVNALASNVLSNEIGKRLESLHPSLRFGIPIVTFLLTLGITILIAVLSV